MAAWDAAQANVALKYDPQQAAIQRAIDAAAAQTQANETSLQGYGNTGREVIGQNYNTLYGLLGNQRTQQQADLGNQAALTDRGYDEADQAVRTQQAAGRQFLDQLATKYNQPGTALQGGSALESLVAEQIGRNSTGRATFGGNLRDWGARMDSIAGEGIGAAHQAEALRRSEFENQLLALLGENKLEGQRTGNELTGKLSDILGSRQNDLISMYNEYAQREWENSFKQAQLDQQAAQANAELSLRAQGMQADNAYRSAQAAKQNDPTMEILKWLAGDKQQKFENNLALSNYDLDKRKLEASLGPSGYDPADVLKGAFEQDLTPEEYLQQLALVQGILSGTVGSSAASPQQAIAAASELAAPQGPSPASSGSPYNSANANPSNKSWNPAKWGSDFVRGMGGMFR